MPTPTSARPSHGTSAPTPARRSGCARRRISTSTRSPTFARIRTCSRFPNLVDELRSVPVEDLVPRGYGSPLPDPPDLRVGRHDGRTQAHRAASRLGRAGDALAGRRLHRGRLRAGSGPAVPDAERAPRRRALRSRGRRTAGRDVPRHRPRPAVGQEARRPRARRRKSRPTSTTSSTKPGSSSKRSRWPTCTPRRPCWRRSPATTRWSTWSTRRSGTCCSAAPTWTSTPTTCCGTCFPQRPSRPSSEAR